MYTITKIGKYSLLLVALLSTLACKKDKNEVVHVKGRVLDYTTREPLDSVKVIMYYGFDAGSTVGVLGTPNNNKKNYQEVIAYTNAKGEYDVLLEGDLTYGVINFFKDKYHGTENSHTPGLEPSYRGRIAVEFPTGNFENVELYMTPLIEVRLQFKTLKYKIPEEINDVRYKINTYYPNGRSYGTSSSSFHYDRDSLPNSLVDTENYPNVLLSDSKLDIEYDKYRSNIFIGSNKVSFQLKGKEDQYFVIDMDVE